jgi:hypothetical protein
LGEADHPNCFAANAVTQWDEAFGAKRARLLEKAASVKSDARSSMRIRPFTENGALSDASARD